MKINRKLFVMILFTNALPLLGAQTTEKTDSLKAAATASVLRQQDKKRKAAKITLFTLKELVALPLYKVLSPGGIAFLGTSADKPPHDQAEKNGWKFNNETFEYGELVLVPKKNEKGFKDFLYGLYLGKMGEPGIPTHAIQIGEKDFTEALQPYIGKREV